MKKQSLFLFSLMVSVILVAQSPQRFSYQAVLRDAQSALVNNSTIGARFTLLQGSLTGEVVYVETQTVQSNSNGLITAEIGSGTVVSGIFDSIAWSEGPFFIKSEFELQGGTNYTLSTSSQLLSVPYAMHANTAFTSKTAENGLKSGAKVGEMLYWNGTNWEELQPGIMGQTLVLCNGKPSWGPCPEVISVNTYEVTEIGSSAARVIFSEIASPNLQRWGQRLCYSKSPDPTEFDFVGYNYQYSGVEFSFMLEELEPGIKYYARGITSCPLGTVYGNTVSFTTSSSPLLLIGQKYAGGYIFYLDASGQHGLVANSEYLELRPWGCEGNLVGSGAQNSEIGAGQPNTQAIINSCTDPVIAAKLCTELTLQGYSDWFLPSVEELRLIFSNLIEKNMPGFYQGEFWTSTEYDVDKAFYLDSPADQKTANKGNWMYFIPVRAF